MLFWTGVVYLIVLYIIAKNVGIDTETWVIILICVAGCIAMLFLVDMLMQLLGAYEVIWKWQTPLLVLD